MHILAVLLATAILASAWSAGFFWSWSFTVMPGLSASSPLAAIEVMRTTNAGIRTPFFAFVFFGPLLLSLATAGLAWMAKRQASAGVALAAAAIYGLGVLAVTFSINVPLNDALAAASVTDLNATTTWRDYDGRWTAWNHIRVVASSATLLLLALGAVLAKR